MCDKTSLFDVSMYQFEDNNWCQQKSFGPNSDPIIMLDLSVKEDWCFATIMKGFKLWNIQTLLCKTLLLPQSVRNVSKKFGHSSSIILSAGDKYGVSGIRKELYIWKIETEELAKIVNAHFQRIIDIRSLVGGKDNSVITSSIDRSLKVWDLNFIFEEDHHIDKHELTIDGLSVSTQAQIAVTVTRSCVGVWDYMTGKLKYTLANSALGAIITHALVTENGQYIVAAESGEIHFWDLSTREVIFSEKHSSVIQLSFNKAQTRCLIVTCSGPSGTISMLNFFYWNQILK